MFPVSEYGRRMQSLRAAPSSPLQPQQHQRSTGRASRPALGSPFAHSLPPQASSFPVGSTIAPNTYTTYQMASLPSPYPPPAGPAVEYATSSTRTGNDVSDPCGSSEGSDGMWTDDHGAYDTFGHPPARTSEGFGQQSALGVSREADPSAGGRDWADGHSNDAIYYDGNSRDGCPDEVGYQSYEGGLVYPSPSHQSPLSTGSLGPSPSIVSDPADGYAYHPLRTNTTPLVQPQPDHLVAPLPPLPRQTRYRAPIPDFTEPSAGPPQAGSSIAIAPTSFEQHAHQTPRRQPSWNSAPSLSPASSTHASYASEMSSALTPSSPFESMVLVDRPQPRTRSTSNNQPAPYPGQRPLVCSPGAMDQDFDLAPSARAQLPPRDHLHQRAHPRFGHEDVDADGYVHVPSVGGLVSLADVAGPGGPKWDVVTRATLKRKHAASAPGPGDDGSSGRADGQVEDDESDEEIKEIAEEDAVKVEQPPVKLNKNGKPQRKKGKAITACAECRRLKQRCDNGAPCSQCINRGVASVCPKGTLANLKGKRLVLTDHAELVKQIDDLKERLAISLSRECPCFSSESRCHRHALGNSSLTAAQGGKK